MHVAVKVRLGLGLAVAVLGTVTAAQGHPLGGVLLTVLAAGYAGGVAELWAAGCRYNARRPAAQAPASTRGGLATDPPTWSEQ